MAKGKGKKKDKGSDIIENPEVLAEQLSRTEKFFSENKILSTSIIIGIVVVVAAIFGYRYYNNLQNEEALSESFQAQFYFEKDSLELALRGDGINLGFVQIEQQYPNTKIGNLANFYAGAIFLKQQKYDLALQYLEDFKSDDLIIQARAYSLLGDVFMEQSNFKEAIKYYQMAAEFKPNEHFSPKYLFKAALAYEKDGDLEQAKATLNKLIEEYPRALEIQNAKKNLARIGG